jgi:hypothetical protein
MTEAAGTIGTLWMLTAALLPESPTTHDFMRKCAKKSSSQRGKIREKDTKKSKIARFCSIDFIQSDSYHIGLSEVQCC